MVFAQDAVPHWTKLNLSKIDMKQGAKNSKGKIAKKTLVKSAPKQGVVAKKAPIAKKKLVEHSKLVSNSAPKKSAKSDLKSKSKLNVKKAISTKSKEAKAPAKKTAVASKAQSEKISTSVKKEAKKSVVNSKSAPAPKKAKLPEKSTPKKVSKKEEPKNSPKKTDSKKVEVVGTAARKLTAAEVIKDLLAKKKKPTSPSSVAAVKSDTPATSDGTVKPRASAGIYFSMADLDEFLATRSNVKNDEKSAVNSKSESKAKAKKVAVAPVVQVPKKAFAAASIADILGFNPIVQKREEIEEKDVPAKWKKYYKLLIEIRERFENAPNDKVESVAMNNGELSHENSTQGMDAADIGSKSFERDMAFNLLSNEQGLISEVNAAIDRIRNGTYGICEITGKPIPESRLTAIPFARCTIDGQRQKEAETKRLKSSKSRAQYNSVELGEDDIPLADSEDSGE